MFKKTALLVYDGFPYNRRTFWRQCSVPPPSAAPSTSRSSSTGCGTVSLSIRILRTQDSPRTSISPTWVENWDDCFTYCLMYVVGSLKIIFRTRWNMFYVLIEHQINVVNSGMCKRSRIWVDFFYMGI